MKKMMKTITTHFRGQILASIQSALLINSRLKNGVFCFYVEKLWWWSCVTGSVLCLPQLTEWAGCCERKATRLGYQLTQVHQEHVIDIQDSSKLGSGLEVHHGWVKVPEPFCPVSDSVPPMPWLHLRIRHMCLDCAVQRSAVGLMLGLSELVHLWSTAKLCKETSWAPGNSQSH